MDDETPSSAPTVAGAFRWLQIASSLVWAATILGVAVAAKASDNFIYELLVMVVGSSLSFTVIDAAGRRSRR